MKIIFYLTIVGGVSIDTLSEQAIKEFKEIYYNRYHTVLSESQAMDKASRVYNYIKAVATETSEEIDNPQKEVQK